MPYKSDAQRRWAHTESGLKALGGEKAVDEWDQASKGKKLPEKVKKMADGGIVNPTSESVTQQPDEFTQGIKSGINADMDKMLGWKDELLNYLKSQFEKGNPDFGSTLGTDNTGFQGLANQKAHETPGYAFGGQIGDSSQEDAFRMGLGAPTPPPIAQFNPNIGLPTSVPPLTTPPQMPATQPQRPVLAPVAPNPYISAQRAQISKYGPEEQLALEQSLLKQRRSLPQAGAVAAGSLADALMQGVARAGNPGFAERIQGTQEERAKEQIGALEKAGTQNLAQTEAAQKLDAMDPTSQLSKIAQQTWGPLLARNGFKPQQIAGMPASAIAALTGQTVEALKAEAEAKMAAASLGLKQQEHETNVAHQKVEEGLGRANEVMKAGEELRSHPIQRLFGVLPGQNALQNIISGAETPGGADILTPDVIAYAQKHNITPEQAYNIKLRRGGK